MKFLIIDNYDSFVYNIAQYMGELGVDCEVIRNDKITIEEIKQKNYDGIIISPGPGTLKLVVKSGLVESASHMIILVIS